VNYWLTWTKGIRGHSSINDPYALTGQVGVSGFRASNSMLIQRYLGINDISFSPDSLYLATASDDTTCLIHALQPLPSPSSSSSRPAPLRILSAHTAPVLAVAFSPKSNLLVTGSFDESAIIWDVKNGTALRVLPAHADAVWTVGWDGEGGMVLTGSADGLV